MKKLLFLFLSLILFSPSGVWAKQGLKLNKLDEIRILSSLNINASFLNDPKYIEMKDNIDSLKTLYFLKTLKKGAIFMPNLHEMLGEADIPDTFLYMAMVESKFLADVKSNKNAAGLWQLMPATAEEFDLEISHVVDERLDPIKSTKAAIEYLTYLHDRFGKWYLAALAYNCGETKLARVIKRLGTDDLAILIDDDQKNLPSETRDYMRRIIIAALLAYDDEIIIKNNANHLFGNCTNSKLVEVFFDGGVSLSYIADQVDIPLEKIKTCNPHLLKNKLPPNRKTYHVYLPEELAGNLKKRNAHVSVGTFVYTVREGDTLFLISKRFNNKLDAIKRLNPNLKKTLRIGQQIRLIGASKATNKKPVPKEKIAITSEPVKQPNIERKPTQKNTKTFIYKVKKGDSPYSVSLQFNNKLETLKKLNPGFPENFKVGQTLVIKH